jgi:hypothetical protein
MLLDPSDALASELAALRPGEAVQKEMHRAGDTFVRLSD